MPPWSELPHRLHDRRKLRDGSRAQVIAEGKSSGHDDRVAILQIVRFMPQKRRLLLEHVLDCPESIVVAVRSRKNDDPKFHGFIPFSGRDN
jgi:hypothetical protein